MDLTSESAQVGTTKRSSLFDRGNRPGAGAPLLHHLAISNNLPLDRIARFFSRMGSALVVEFVPKSDSQVQRLLATRADVFPNYERAGFEAAFAPYFETLDTRPVAGSERSLYLMRRRGRVEARS
jgi:hypothetical protein